MVSIHPVVRALVPLDTESAERISAFCRVALQRDLPDDALEWAARRLEQLEESPLTRVAQHVLVVYEIADPQRKGVRQIGVGGMAATREIRTDARPFGTIVRNEGICERKARGQARLIRRTGASLGIVHLAVEDLDGRLAAALRARADSRPEDFHAADENGCIHRVWIVEDPRAIRKLTAALAREPRAYVADGNHRTSAVTDAGLDEFLAVFFPAKTLGLAPYNRLVRGPRLPLREILPALDRAFRIEPLPGRRAFQPVVTHQIGLYGAHEWLRLTPFKTTFNPASAVGALDASIVQRRLFDEVLGISDPADDRLKFVGGDRSASYLATCVDSGEFAYALTLPAVTIEQFLRVCRQGRFMPPKSTWFQPKVRMGLVTALSPTPLPADAGHDPPAVRRAAAPLRPSRRRRAS